MAHPQGGNAVFKIVVRHHLLENGLVACQFQIAAGHIGLAGLVSQYQFRVLFVADADVHILHQVFHDSLGLLGGPQLLTEVQINGNFHAVLLSGNQRLLSKLCRAVGHGGSDAREVEPVGALKDGVKVKIRLGGRRDGGMGPVIYHLGGPHGRTALQEVNAQSLAALCDMLCGHIIFSQSSHSALADLVVGHCSDKFRVMSIIGQGHGHIGLAAAIAYIKLVCLYKLLVVRSGQPQHDLTHSNHFCHWIFPHLS